MDKFVSLCVLLMSIGVCWSELFTAITHMEGLVNMEKDLLHGLNSYIEAEKQRLRKLEVFAKKVNGAVEAADSDGANHLYNPVNIFQLVNRFENNWHNIENRIYSANSQELMSNISMGRHQFPTQEDVDGSIAALLRLQETYSLQPQTVSNGSLGTSNGLSMSSEDCFAIGEYAYNKKEWRHCREWMLTALEQFEQENDSSLNIPSVYDYLAFSEFELGNVKKSFLYNKVLLQHNASHKRALDNQKYLDTMKTDEPDRFIDNEIKPEVDPAFAKYEQLCREPDPIPSHLHKKLICFYYTNNRNPRLVLAPIKTEVAFLRPKIYIFHDFLSDKEIERLKELATPRLKRALVDGGDDGQGKQVKYRISKSGWLGPHDDPLGYVKRIDQRIEDVTGLDMSTAEKLQVVNYGIGGQYEPHHDYDIAVPERGAFDYLGNTGNRISTLLIYLSDVELGGATVFPLVGARISPIKGSASYWWNLKKSGKGDFLTKHAGCPVLVGSKWVCNKWIHEAGQEFRRPCGLSPNQ